MEDNTNVPTDYKHRTVDENGNADDKFTEQEALDLAAKQGIEFIDSYYVVLIGSEPPNEINSSDAFETRAEAEQALSAKEDADRYTIVQTRRQKPQE